MADYDAIDNKSYALHAVLIATLLTRAVHNTPDTLLYILWKPPSLEKILGVFGNRTKYRELAKSPIELL